MQARRTGRSRKAGRQEGQKGVGLGSACTLGVSIVLSSVVHHSWGKERGNTMPVPFEALLPFGIIVTMFTVAGGGMAFLRTLSNDGKPTRHNLDVWDRQSKSQPQTSPLTPSDGARPAPDRLPARTDRRAHRAQGVQPQLAMEAGEAFPQIMYLLVRSIHPTLE